MVKFELAQSANATATDSEIKTLLSNKQKFLATEYAWPFLQHRWDVSVSPSNRYLPIPTVNELAQTTPIDFERPVVVEVRWNNRWQEVQYGIGSGQFNYLNSDASIAAVNPMDPIQRWRFSDDNFEIWPIPTTASVVRFTGQRELNPLIATNDTADLDDQLLILGVVADKLQYLNKPQIAQMKMQQYEKRLLHCRAAPTGNNQNIVIGGGIEEDNSGRARRIVPLVTIHG